MVKNPLLESKWRSPKSPVFESKKLSPKSPVFESKKFSPKSPISESKKFSPKSPISESKKLSSKSSFFESKKLSPKSPISEPKRRSPKSALSESKTISHNLRRRSLNSPIYGKKNKSPRTVPKILESALSSAGLKEPSPASPIINTQIKSPRMIARIMESPFLFGVMGSSPDSPMTDSKAKAILDKNSPAFSPQLLTRRSPASPLSDDPFHRSTNKGTPTLRSQTCFKSSPPLRKSSPRFAPSVRSKTLSSMPTILQSPLLKRTPTKSNPPTPSLGTNLSSPVANLKTATPLKDKSPITRYGSTPSSRSTVPRSLNMSPKAVTPNSEISSSSPNVTTPNLKSNLFHSKIATPTQLVLQSETSPKANSPRYTLSSTSIKNSLRNSPITSASTPPFPSPKISTPVKKLTSPKISPKLQSPKFKTTSHTLRNSPETRTPSPKISTPVKKLTSPKISPKLKFHKFIATTHTVATFPSPKIFSPERKLTSPKIFSPARKLTSPKISPKLKYLSTESAFPTQAITISPKASPNILSTSKTSSPKLLFPTKSADNHDPRKSLRTSQRFKLNSNVPSSDLNPKYRFNTSVQFSMTENKKLKSPRISTPTSNKFDNSTTKMKTTTTSSPIHQLASNSRISLSFPITHNALSYQPNTDTKASPTITSTSQELSQPQGNLLSPIAGKSKRSSLVHLKTSQSLPDNNLQSDNETLANDMVTRRKRTRRSSNGAAPPAKQVKLTNSPTKSPAKTSAKKIKIISYTESSNATADVTNDSLPGIFSPIPKHRFRKHKLTGTETLPQNKRTVRFSSPKYVFLETIAINNVIPTNSSPQMQKVRSILKSKQKTLNSPSKLIEAKTSLAKTRSSRSKAKKTTQKQTRNSKADVLTIETAFITERRNTRSRKQGPDQISSEKNVNLELKSNISSNHKKRPTRSISAASLNQKTIINIDSDDTQPDPVVSFTGKKQSNPKISKKIITANEKEYQKPKSTRKQSKKIDMLKPNIDADIKMNETNKKISTKSKNKLIENSNETKKSRVAQNNSSKTLSGKNTPKADSDTPKRILRPRK